MAAAHPAQTHVLAFLSALHRLGKKPLRVLKTADAVAIEHEAAKGTRQIPFLNKRKAEVFFKDNPQHTMLVDHHGFYEVISDALGNKRELSAKELERSLKGPARYPKTIVIPTIAFPKLKAKPAPKPKTKAAVKTPSAEALAREEAERKRKEAEALKRERGKLVSMLRAVEEKKREEPEPYEVPEMPGKIVLSRARELRKQKEEDTRQRVSSLLYGLQQYGRKLKAIEHVNKTFKVHYETHAGKPRTIEIERAGPEKRLVIEHPSGEPEDVFIEQDHTYNHLAKVWLANELGRLSPEERARRMLELHGVTEEREVARHKEPTSIKELLKPSAEKQATIDETIRSHKEAEAAAEVEKHLREVLQKHHDAGWHLQLVNRAGKDAYLLTWFRRKDAEQKAEDYLIEVEKGKGAATVFKGTPHEHEAHGDKLFRAFGQLLGEQKQVGGEELTGILARRGVLSQSRTEPTHEE